MGESDDRPAARRCQASECAGNRGARPESGGRLPAAPSSERESLKAARRVQAAWVKSWRFVAGAGHIFGVTAAILMNAVGSEFEHPVRQRGQEVAVMRNEQHGAFE